MTVKAEKASGALQLNVIQFIFIILGQNEDKLNRYLLAMGNRESIMRKLCKYIESKGWVLYLFIHLMKVKSNIKVGSDVFWTSKRWISRDSISTNMKDYAEIKSQQTYQCKNGNFFHIRAQVDLILNGKLCANFTIFTNSLDAIRESTYELIYTYIYLSSYTSVLYMQIFSWNLYFYTM